MVMRRVEGAFPNGRLQNRAASPVLFGYRIYFGKDGDALVILVGGGTKKHQDTDIRIAHERWEDFKERKTREK